MGLWSSYVQVSATGESWDPGVDTGQNECLSPATGGIHIHMCHFFTDGLSS